MEQMEMEMEMEVCEGGDGRPGRGEEGTGRRWGIFLLFFFICHISNIYAMPTNLINRIYAEWCKI